MYKCNLTGSLFNHSPTPNVTYTKRKDLQCIEYKTVKSVEANEELLIFYGHKLWFEVNEMIPGLSPVTCYSFVVSYMMYSVFPLYYTRVP